MKFRITCEYRVIENSVAHNYEAEKIYSTVDAAMATQEMLDQIVSTAQGIITMIRIKCEMIHEVL